MEVNPENLVTAVGVLDGSDVGMANGYILSSISLSNCRWVGIKIAFHYSLSGVVYHNFTNAVRRK